MLKVLSCAVALAAGGGAVSAATVNATLDFTELGVGVIPTQEATITNATLRSGGNAFFVGGGEIPNSICALDTSLFNTCANDLAIEFVGGEATNLTFNVGGYDPLDSVELSIYDEADLLGTIVITDDGLVDLSAYGGVRLLFFDDSSGGAGLSYGNFQFDLAAIPLPAALPLLLGGLGALALARRRG